MKSLYKKPRELTGEAIQAARVNRGLSKPALAARAGLDIQTLDYYERGRSTPNVDKLWDIADALGVHPGDLLARDDFTSVREQAGFISRPSHATADQRAALVRAVASIEDSTVRKQLVKLVEATADAVNKEESET